ncbi:hypothetical protein B0H16DRAFT_1724527 [Mycena metata]|uniref:Uncharacterized protein n=1 Tax=Mycena metata TaxID=1033252 RepID=A0AAD7IW61_9AGAR|nr:hypothetical protein B0H16DRAFT_1724527 [Mycena metata]
MRPFSFAPPRPLPLPTQATGAPSADEIPFQSGSRATSLAAEMCASSLADREEGEATPTRASPVSVKAEDAESATVPFVDERVWDVDGETLEEMDLSTENAAGS